MGGHRGDTRRRMEPGLVSSEEIGSGAVWFVDLDPVRGREQGKDRPALVVSSSFHLRVTGGALVSVLPLTTRERRGWLHRIHLSAAQGWVLTEQVRTLSTQRFRRRAPELDPTDEELTEVRRVLRRMVL